MQNVHDKIRFVYVGALSLETMYTKEFANWVVSQNGHVEWDIYTFNLTQTARSYFKSLQSPYINLLPGVDYDELPHILSRYDIGLILYIGHIPNYVHNAPNKLFEYLRMGLQVWLPQNLLGSLPYVETLQHPRVLALDFNNLTVVAADISVQKTIRENKFIAEEANEPLVRFLGA